MKPSGKAQPPDQKTFEREVNAVSREIKEKQAKLVCSHIVPGRECEWEQCWLCRGGSVSGNSVGCAGEGV